jgi:hypothetical protein
MICPSSQNGMRPEALTAKLGSHEIKVLYMFLKRKTLNDSPPTGFLCPTNSPTTMKPFFR